MNDKSLLHCLINVRSQHPERMNATFERVVELLTMICDHQAMDIAHQCQSAASVVDLRKELTSAQAKAIADILEQQLSASQMETMQHLLMDAEISMAEAIDLHETYKIPVSRLEKDIVFVRGQGTWNIDLYGQRYLDMDSNYSATNLGSANEEIALGLFNQASQLISTKEDRVHIPRTRFLKMIHQILPTGLTQFYWQNSGGEAVDKSIKIAKAYTQQRGVIAFEGSFHGRTHGAVAVTHNPVYRQPFQLDQVDWVHFAPFNNAKAVEAILKSGKAKIVILELVQGEESGIRPAQKDFPKQLRELCDQYGALLICDEVQTGFGRVATKPGEWWASQVYGITPDIMAIGKSFGGGYPVTAVVTSAKISQAMKPGYDGSTFGGNPMAMVAAFIAIRQMQEKNLTANVVARSAQFVAGLNQIKSPLIKGIRALGLMIGIDLPSHQHVVDLQERLKQYQIHSSLSTNQTIRLMPPLIISENEVAFALSGIEQALQDLETGTA